jgi:hypothetical protein
VSIDVQELRDILETDKSGWSEVYKQAQDDIAFLSPGGQWEEKMRLARYKALMPALEIDQLTQYVHQVVNAFRMDTPLIDVLPSDNEATIETAKIVKGLVRRIEYKSAADAAYEMAMEYAVKGGIGFVRVEHGYASDDGFDQELIIKRVPNPFSIFMDSSIMECDGRDAMHCTILDSYSKSAFEKRWPDAKFISFDGDGKTESKDGESINVAEFYRVEESSDSKALMQDGSVLDYRKGMDGVKTVRQLKRRKVYRCLLNGEEELESTYFPGIYVPVVPFFGEECWIDGKRHVFSLIRRSKDAQRRFNMWASKEMEFLLKAPTAPVVVAAGQLAGFEENWQNPENALVLEYNPKDAHGIERPAPQRLAPPPVPTGIINAMQGAAEHIKSTIGMYDASLGNRSNEVSGIAIENRQRKGDVSTFHFSDNGVRSITQVGRILVSGIREVYDTGRIVSILGEEDNHKMVGINGHLSGDQRETYDLKSGSYDVSVTTGPSFTTKRQETNALMNDVMVKNPGLMQIMGDLFFKYSDVAGADAIASRLKKTIPPALLEDDGAKPENTPAMQQAQQQVQQLAQALQQAQQQGQQMGQELQKLQQDAGNKQGEIDIKNRELDLRQAEIVLQQADSKMPQRQGFVGAGQPKTGGGQMNNADNMDEEQLVQLIQRKRTQAMQAQQELQAQQDAADGKEQARLDERNQDIQLKQAAMQQNQFLVEQLIAEIRGLTQAIQAPKEVTRDDQGRVIGVH